ncbi:LysE family translocator [Halopseudomonas pelagia]|uniref:Flagellar biosynthesis protein FlgM n=1 Tax=Halopseudomonas pelagia TaxID=553151 RepID=A0AA91Z7E3_9GAMM|nr:LysE family transporter [Halopseudomonas pelagia]PCD00924.1 flagellar biosynthesis protein FlgM [Halopseudomonas pelagia]QFY58212.1 LysE family translocator [Halopseudomonas pelagia]
MTFSTWLLYVAAVLVLTVTPGPSVLMCVSTSVNLGARKALIASLGSTTAIVCIMALSALGLGAALAASDILFTALKWLGAAYLAYLGISSIISSTSEIAVSGAVESSTGRRLFTQGFLVGASNPKALLFFGALFPQFIIPSEPHLPQFLLLGVTFIFFELLWLTIYALSASKAKIWLQQPRRAKLFNRITGGVFLVAAGLLASSKRASA